MSLSSSSAQAIIDRIVAEVSREMLAEGIPEPRHESILSWTGHWRGVLEARLSAALSDSFSLT